MAADPAVFETMKAFLDFGPTDIANLQKLGPIFARRGGEITDRFYKILGENPETAAFIEGRVDALKGTHARWMGELFAGDYGDAYFQNRIRVGMAHVRIGLDTWWVEGVMSFLRTSAAQAIREEVADPDEGTRLLASLVKILDLDLLVINVAYAEERLDRLHNFTGMSRKLIERCIRKG